MNHKDKKARDIVAMLFWEWKQIQRYVGKGHAIFHEISFKKAYLMLKNKNN